MKLTNVVRAGWRALFLWLTKLSIAAESAVTPTLLRADSSCEE